MSGTCAIVVTFNPDITALLKLLGQLNRETDFVVIDNGSEKTGKFASSIEVYERCRELRRLPDNLGLAAALNLGLEQARDEGYEFALLFDQDSSLGDQYVSRLLAAYHEASALTAGRIAAIGPRIINPQTRSQTRFKLFNRLFSRSDQPFGGSQQHFRADFLITSGTLVPLAVLEDIGMMKASYFIDNVDMEWCFRARARGYELVGTDQAIIYHAIGERSDNPLVRRGLMAQHNPARSYYSSRNRVHLYSQPYSPWGWKLRDVPRFFLKACWLLLASPQRAQYWRSIRDGIRDSRSLV
ncbi:MAG: hypothetical protein RLZZ385_2615 [Pseudomonadota bacterium]|jgi:rhamnosyltransferase